MDESGGHCRAAFLYIYIRAVKLYLVVLASDSSVMEVLLDCVALSSGIYVFFSSALCSNSCHVYYRFSLFSVAEDGILRRKLRVYLYLSMSPMLDLTTGH